MWIMLSRVMDSDDPFEEDFAHGPFNTEERAIAEVKWCAKQLIEAGQSLGQEVKVTNGSLAHPEDVFVEDESGTYWIRVMQLQDGCAQV